MTGKKGMKRRRRFTDQEKLDAIEQVDALRAAEDLKIQDACAKLGHATHNVGRWRAELRKGKIQRPKPERQGAKREPKVDHPGPLVPEVVGPVAGQGLFQRLETIERKVDALLQILVG